jgi:ppGpp synthetase/RelA/SpoT-type nucleotidyltranferase
VRKYAISEYPVFVDEASEDLLLFLKANESRHKSLNEEVQYILKDIVEKAGVKIHSISGRVKDPDHAFEKAARKGYINPSEELEDIVGCRIVCLFISDLEKIADAIKGEFRVHKAEDKVGGSADPATFGYMSMHYICELTGQHSGARYNRLKGLKFEIQCRTILMDAWANVSHHLAYKGENSIPSDLRRDFNALSGLFYVADKHFELFFQEADESRRDTLKRAEDGHLGDSERIDIETTIALFAALYPGIRKGHPSITSDFVEEVAKAGYRGIGHLKRQLEKGHRAVELWQEANPDESPVFFAGLRDVGHARIALAAADAKFAVQKYEKNAKKYARYRPFLEDT